MSWAMTALKLMLFLITHEWVYMVSVYPNSLAQSLPIGFVFYEEYHTGPPFLQPKLKSSDLNWFTWSANHTFWSHVSNQSLMEKTKSSFHWLQGRRFHPWTLCLLAQRIGFRNSTGIQCFQLNQMPQMGLGCQPLLDNFWRLGDTIEQRSPVFLIPEENQNWKFLSTAILKRVATCGPQLKWFSTYKLPIYITQHLSSSSSRANSRFVQPCSLAFWLLTHSLVHGQMKDTC